MKWSHSLVSFLVQRYIYRHSDTILLNQPLQRDGFIRVVKIWCNCHEYKHAVQKLITLMRRDGQSPTSLPGSVSRPKSLD